MYTYYCVAVMNKGGLASGMYTRSVAYETPELAAALGASDPHLHANGERLAVVRVETTETATGDRLPLRETILSLIRVES